MAYAAYEGSDYNGEPIELIVFRDDSGLLSWAFTTADTDVEIDSIWYRKGVISRSAVRQASGDALGDLQIELSAAEPMLQQFNQYLPARPIGATVMRYHALDGVTNRETLWSGQVLSVAFGSDGMATLQCESILSAMKRKTPYQVYKGGCNNALFEPGCNLVRSVWATALPTYSISGLTITSSTIAGFDDGWFAAGYAEYPATGERRWITKHEGGTITLVYPFTSLPGAVPLTLYPGCQRTRQACSEKFNNLANFFGFDYIPEDNPFDRSFGPTGDGGAGGGSNGDTIAPWTNIGQTEGG